MPYDGNASEEGFEKLRSSKRSADVSARSRGADHFMNIHSVVETARKNGNSKYNAILAILG